MDERGSELRGSGVMRGRRRSRLVSRSLDSGSSLHDSDRVSVPR